MRAPCWCWRTCPGGNPALIRWRLPACSRECTGSGRAKHTCAGHGCAQPAPQGTWWNSCMPRCGRSWPRAPISHRQCTCWASACGEASPESERMISAAGPLTLVHGDASMLNMRTGPGGQVALLDWEDVSAAPGVLDLAWLLVSSVEPAQWDEVAGAYGPGRGMNQVLPAVAVQGLLSLSNTSAGSPEATAWIRRLDAAAARL